MSEALHEHLEDQRAASIREWSAANQRFIRSLTWTRNACSVIFAYSLTYWLLPTDSPLRGLHSMLSLVWIMLMVFRSVMHIRQSRLVKRLEGIAAALQYRHFRLHADELCEMMRKHLDEGEEWKR